MKGYTRDPGSKKKLVYKGGTLYTKEKCEIHVLASLEDKGLINIGKEVEVVGSLAIVFPKSKSYVVMNSMAMYKIKPETIKNEIIDDRSYYIFEVLAGSPVALSSEILVEGDLVYTMLDTYYFLGRVPWFMSYEKGDVTQFFTTGGKHSGVAIDKVPAILSILSAQQARSIDDVSELARYATKIKDANVKIVSIKHHNDGVTHNFNKITGSYQSEGILSAVVKNKVGRATIVEEIVRSQ